MSLEPGTTLGPYEVVAEIGRGGMGEVSRARDTKLDRDVALKEELPVCRREVSTAAEAVARLSMSHPWATSRGRLWCVQPLQAVAQMLIDLRAMRAEAEQQAD